MALVSEGWKLTVKLVDASIEDSSTLTYKLNPATVTDHTTAVAARTAILAALGGVTNCAIAQHSLNEVFKENALVAPVDGTEVENIALYVLRIDGPDPLKTATVKVPGPKPAVFDATQGPGRNDLNENLAANITYAELWNTGEHATLSDGETTEAGSTGGIVEGKRIHRRSSDG